MPKAAKRFGSRGHVAATGLIRAHAAARGYGWKWQQYSRARLAHGPRCAGVLVQGKVVHAASCAGMAQCVDHIEACGPDDRGFWLESNHQALSIACNSLKRVKVDYVK